MLFGFWYPAMLSRDLHAGAIYRAATLLELPLAVGRDAQGRAFALADLCPHRAMPLSFGRVAADTVECCYHGWKFNAHSGQCPPSRRLLLMPTSRSSASSPKITNVPSATATSGFSSPIPTHATQNHLRRFPNFLFSASATAPLTSASSFPPTSIRECSACSIPRMDPTCTSRGTGARRIICATSKKLSSPFPTDSAWCRTRPPRIAAKLLGVYGQPVTTTIDFVLPNQRTEMIRCGKLWFTNRTVVTPIRRDLCRLDFCAAWNLFRWVPFVTPIFTAFARKFIAQDQHNMQRQAVGLRQNPPDGPPMMLVGDADRQARWYYELKAALLQSRRTGEPMVHPLQGPVTLRWRT